MAPVVTAGGGSHDSNRQQVAQRSPPLSQATTLAAEGTASSGRGAVGAPWRDLSLAGCCCGCCAVLGWLRPHQGSGVCCTPFPRVPLLVISAQQYSETSLCHRLCECQRRDALRS